MGRGAGQFALKSPWQNVGQERLSRNVPMGNVGDRLGGRILGVGRGVAVGLGEGVNGFLKPKVVWAFV